MQHREWNPKSFFKKLSPAVMAAYEAEHKLALARDASKPPHDQTYHAWVLLPEAQRLKLETELLPVNDMCSPHARPYLEAQARLTWTDGDAHLIDESRDWTAHDLAMRLYLADAAGFARAHQAYAVDMMEHFKEYRGKHPVTLRATPAAKERMKREMTAHFREYAGGARCQVEDFEGKDKFALFIYHEDEMTPLDRFDDAGVVVPDWQRPVVRIAAVFYPDTFTLLVKAPRQPEREKLRDLFAEIFIGDTDYFEDTSKTPKYSFDPIRDAAFTFPTHPADGIDEVSVVRVTARPAHAYVKRSNVELTPGLSTAGLHEALDSQGIDAGDDPIDGVRLQFQFEGKGRSRFRTVSLHNPNSTNLRDTTRDRLIRRYLKEWGFDGTKSALALAVPALGAAPVVSATAQPG